MRGYHELANLSDAVLASCPKMSFSAWHDEKESSRHLPVMSLLGMICLSPHTCSGKKRPRLNSIDPATGREKAYPEEG